MDGRATDAICRNQLRAEPPHVSFFNCPPGQRSCATLVEDDKKKSRTLSGRRNRPSHGGGGGAAAGQAPGHLGSHPCRLYPVCNLGPTAGPGSGTSMILPTCRAPPVGACTCRAQIPLRNVRYSTGYLYIPAWLLFRLTCQRSPSPEWPRMAWARRPPLSWTGRGQAEQPRTGLSEPGTVDTALITLAQQPGQGVSWSLVSAVSSRLPLLPLGALAHSALLRILTRNRRFPFASSHLTSQSGQPTPTGRPNPPRRPPSCCPHRADRISALQPVSRLLFCCHIA